MPAVGGMGSSTSLSRPENNALPTEMCRNMVDGMRHTGEKREGSWGQALARKEIKAEGKPGAGEKKNEAGRCQRGTARGKTLATALR